MTTKAKSRTLSSIAGECDKSTRLPAFVGLFFALYWLIAGSFLGELSSLKLHLPDLLTDQAWLTFGRVRPAHLNAMIYGWASNGMFAVSLWLIARLSRATLRWRQSAMAGIFIWNLGVLSGVIGILAGISDGMEWLEMSRALASTFLVLGAVLIGASVWKTLAARDIKHLYVSAWYIGAAFIWFPIIYIIGKLPIFTGVENAAVNWFFAHNALGLWLTAVNLGVIYYLIPKILGRPIHSYWLSLVGFWALAFFYSLNGMHHLIGGPLPTWMITTSIVASIMMVIPVLSVAVNHHMTMVGRFSSLKYSPTLTFIVLGAMSYTGVSLQGIMQSLVEVNRVTHFTHWTIAHAHMGVYSFVTFTLFGAIYYMLPRIVGREWPSAKLIRWHLYLVVVGIFLYIFGLGIGGVLQGLALSDPTRPFSDSVSATIPWLWVRSFAGLLLTAGHFVFFSHVLMLVFGKKSRISDLPPWYEISPIVLERDTLGVTDADGASL